jgi:hypothetical protein
LGNLLALATSPVPSMFSREYGPFVFILGSLDFGEEPRRQ